MSTKSRRYFANYFLAPREQMVFSLQMVFGVIILAELQLVVMSGFLGGDTPFLGAQFALASSIVLIALYTLVVSHRVFGPVHAMQKYVDKMVAGEAQGPLKLRDGDYFSDLAERLSKLQSQLDARYAEQ